MRRATPSRLGRLGDRRRDGERDVAVEHARDHVLGPELVVRDHRRDRVAGGDLHPLGDRARPDVERAAEHAGEREHVVDLVRVVRAAGRDDGDLAGRQILRRDLGRRVGHREHDRVVGHPLDPRARDGAGHREAEVDVGAGEELVGRALQAVGVRALGERLLDRVQPLAAVVDRPVVVAADHGAHAGVEQDVRHRDAGGADAGRHDRDVLDPLADDAERVEERGEHDDRGAVLVVVEDGDVELGAQPLLDLEAAWGGDVLEVDAAEARARSPSRSRRSRPVSFVSRQSGQASTPPNSLNSSALPSITGIAASGPMSPSPSTAVPSETTATVFCLIVRFQAELAVGGDRLADARHAGRVRHREVVAGLDRHLRLHLDLAAEVHQERAVGDVLDLDALDAANALDDPLEVLGVGRVDRDVAHLDALLDADEVDRAERAAGLADRAARGARTTPGASASRTRMVALNDADTWLMCRITPSAASAAISSGS